MMIYDAFVRRVISSNKLVFNKLAPIMMLLRKNTFKKVKLGANGPWGVELYLTYQLPYRLFLTHFAISGGRGGPQQR